VSKAAAKEERPLARTVADPWPRVRDWFETMMPADALWRGPFSHSPRVEEVTTDGHWTFRFELPGIDPVKDVDVSLSDGYLVVEGHREVSRVEPARTEFAYGKFLRTIPLPAGVLADDIDAQYADGILEVTVRAPKSSRDSAHIPVRRSLAGPRGSRA